VLRARTMDSAQVFSSRIFVTHDRKVSRNGTVLFNFIVSISALDSSVLTPSEVFLPAVINHMGAKTNTYPELKK
jgi:hypothetical protein